MQRAFASRAPAARARGVPPAAQPPAAAAIGNQQLLRALGVRAKLSVSEPGDAAEQEADRMAERFTSAPEVRVARKCASCADEEQIQRKASAPAKSPAELDDALPELRASHAQPLPRGLRGDFERFFDMDLSSVRVHAGGPAARASASLNAQAFTRGRDIYFAQGRYQPHGTEGKKLLAHEITHVAQNASEGSRTHARPSAAVHRQLLEIPIEPFTRIGPELGRIGPELGRIGPEVGRIGPEVGRIAPEVGRIAPEVGRIGPEVGRPGPGLDRISPEWRPWSPEGWRAPPEIGRGPTPAPEGWRIPWGMTRPFPPVFPQPQPQPQPQPEEPEDKDPRCGTPQLPLTRVTFFPGPLGQGSRVKASPLTKCPGNTIGSEPDNSIYRDQFDCITAAGQRGSWVRAHLLHGRTSSSGPFNLHGPGTTPMNLIITDQSLNQQMRRGAEAPAIARVWGASEVLWYDSKVDAYSPGLDYFGQSITVDYGAYNTATGTEGPRLGGGTFTLKRTPPFCPANAAPGTTPGGPPPGGVTPGEGGAPSMAPAAAAAGTAGAAATGAPASQLAFQSTLQICYHVLESRRFQVSNGGLVVRIDARWFDRNGETERSASDCPMTEYQITLKKKGWIFDSDIGDTQNLTVGRSETLVWRYLDPGEYTLYIESANDNPYCCLSGELSVSTFDAPPVTTYTGYNPNLIA